MSAEVIQYSTLPSLEPMVDALDKLVLPNDNHLTDLHKLRGVMDGDVFDTNGEAYDLGQQDGGDLDEWRNVTRHCLMVSLITDVLGEALGMPEEDRRIANMAALFHDSGKKTERNWQREIEANPTAFASEQRRGLSSIDDQKQQALRDVVPMEEWENVEFGISPAAARLMTVNTPKTVDGPQTDLEKIMWLADACLRMTTIMSAAERMEQGRIDAINGSKNAAYSESFRAQFGGKSLFELQVAIAERLVPELAARIGIEPDSFYGWLNDRVQERIAVVQLPLY